MRSIQRPGRVLARVRTREATLDDVLAWIEPLVFCGLALHGIVELSGRTGGGWVPVSAYLLGVAIGFTAIAMRLPGWIAFRGGVVLALPWIGAILGGGASSPVITWYAAAVAVYAVALPAGWGVRYVGAAAASSFTMAVLPGAAIGFVGVAIRAALLLAGGYVVGLLGGRARRLSGERLVAEAELRRAKTRFQAAFSSATSGMAMTALDGTILIANQSLSDVLRVRSDDLTGAVWQSLVHESDRAGVERRLSELATQEIWSFRDRVRFVRSDGTPAWCILGVTQVADDEGQPINLFVNVQDIHAWISVEDQLRRNEEHYRNLFGRSPIAMWELDFTDVGAWLAELREQGVAGLADHLWKWPHLVRRAAERIKVVDVNDAAVGLVHAPDRDTLLQGLPAEMLTDEMLDALAAQLSALWDGTDRVRATVKLDSFKGRHLEAIVHFATPVVDDGPDLGRVAMALTDITEYRKTQDALTRIENRLRAVVGAAPIVLFALDQYGVFTMSEGQGLLALDLRPGEAVGRSAFEMFRNDPQMIRAVRRALSGEAFTTMVTIADLVFDTRFNPMWADGKISGVIGVAYDVTERTRAAERLEQLIKSKDEFVASVSHELRTPLTAVVGFSHELRQGLDDFTPEEITSIVSLIADQSTDVADLVEDLLVAARVDIDKVAIAPRVLSVREHVDSVLAARRDHDGDRTVAVAGDDAKAYADPVRVRQILRNLVSNADRYGGRRIDIAIANGGDVVTVEVRDDGSGVPEQDRARIFEPYFRAHRFETQPNSVGLGLTVSRQLARIMGGDLTYRYEADTSIFALTLPAPV